MRIPLWPIGGIEFNRIQGLYVFMIAATPLAWIIAGGIVLYLVLR